MSDRDVIVGDPLVAKLKATVEHYGLLSPGEKVAVAVSGGPDSVALLAALDALARGRRWRLAVCHVNHGLRGRESGQDARLVRGLAKCFALPVYVEKLRLAGKGKGRAAVSEELLRRKRYEALGRLARRARASVVALGHHRDDLAETVLMNFLRGAGPAGLGGFQAKVQMGKMTLIRPLYECTRDEILEFCRRRGLPWREDRSNRDRRWLRNRIRHGLLPLLERDYNPRLRERLADNARWFREDEAYFEARAREALKAAPGQKWPPQALAVAALAALDLPVVARLFRLWIMAAGALKSPPPGRQIQDLIALVRRKDRAGGREVRCTGDIVFYVDGKAVKWRKVPGRKVSVAQAAKG